MGFEKSAWNRLIAIFLMGNIPLLIAFWLLLFLGNFSPWVIGIVGPTISALSVLIYFRLRRDRARPLQTLANIVAALREGDTSVRARSESGDAALDHLTQEINSLADLLKSQRLGERETSAMLDQVIREIDVAILAFDGEKHLQLINRAGAALLQKEPADLLGRDAAELGLADCLEGPAERTLDDGFFPVSGRWNLRRSPFRREGLPHQLLVFSDLSRALREEERQAWQRLIRVLSHELNNSLAPIKSLAGTLLGLLQKPVALEDWREDLREGLGIIASRSESLNRFLASYASFARLPAPQKKIIALPEMVRRVAELNPIVLLLPGPPLQISVDPDQIEQVLLNLLKNALEAAQETSGNVTITWRIVKSCVLLEILDEGPGISGTINLFVPFFTTKAQGSGIGLVLSRQIAEAHGGSLALENREVVPGCRATLSLPL